MITTENMTQKIDQLPAFSAAVARVNELLNDDSAVAGDFEDAILVDPALTVNLLKFANSAYFGCRSEVRSVGQAVMLIGTKRLRELVLSAAFSRVLPDQLPGYDVAAESFWAHSVATAVIGESLAKSLSQQHPDLDPEVVFTAGLLHDMGKLALCDFFAKGSSEVFALMDSTETSLVEAERKVLGLDHAESGALVAQAWGLPQEFVAVARYHHHPEEAPEKYQVLVDTVHTSNALASLLGYGNDCGELACQISPGIAQRLGFKVRNIETIACETHERIADLGASLQRH